MKRFGQIIGIRPEQSASAYMDLFYIMEQLTTFRAEVVQQLLENTGNIKVKRFSAGLTGQSGFSTKTSGAPATGLFA